MSSAMRTVSAFSPATPTFTDGWNHWGLTATGLIAWTGASIDPLALAWAPPLGSKTGGCQSLGGLPDAECTPGALNPAVTQETIHTTICQPGYSTRIRPPTSYTTPLERQLIAAYGYVGRSPADFELDHLISLELGGHPRDPANLWPQPWTGALNARNKDLVEGYLNRQVCSGAMPLSEAQRLEATDWVSVYRQLRP